MTNSEKLVSIRNSIGWTQEQMAGTLGLDRSYLSLLESGKRPVSDAIVRRAESVMYEAQRLTPPADLPALQERIKQMPSERLMVVYEYFVGRRNDAPDYAQPFYQFLTSLIMREMTNRMGASLSSERIHRRRDSGGEEQH